jgi:hypothetical protein
MTPALLLTSLLAATPPGAQAPAAQKTPPQKAPAMNAAANLEADVKAWHERRLANLTSEDGWLTLVGLHWLEPGENRFGSAEDNKLVFPPNAPKRIGTFTLKGEEVTLAVEPGVGLQKDGQPFPGGVVKSDDKGKPDLLQLGSFRFLVIKRGEKYGIRVKDTEAETRKKFSGIPTFPVSAAWRLEAKWEPFPTPKKISVPNVLGTVEELPSPGTAVFTLNGTEYRLDPVLEGDKLFFIFWDETGKTDTYGAGRFLYADAAKDGKVVLDFNRAYNPPCAFTHYATCPLPPKQNRLKGLRVEAGEKRYGDH